MRQLGQTIKENPFSLHLKRVPLQTKKEFLAWADNPDTFCSDYGFAFKELWESYNRNHDMQERIKELENKISSLESNQKVEEEQSSVKTMLDGTTRRIRK
jgi:uncharacterized membrane protein